MCNVLVLNVTYINPFYIVYDHFIQQGRKLQGKSLCKIIIKKHEKWSDDHRSEFRMIHMKSCATVYITIYKSCIINWWKYGNGLFGID